MNDESRKSESGRDLTKNTFSANTCPKPYPEPVEGLVQGKTTSPIWLFMYRHNALRQ